MTQINGSTKRTNTPNIYWLNTPNNLTETLKTPDSSTNSVGKDEITLSDEFVKAKKSNGLFERFYDFCKNKTGFGLGSRKLEQKIAGFEKGEVKEEDAKKSLSDYRISQENAAQNFGDLASGLVAITGYFGLSNQIKKFNAITTLNHNAIDLAKDIKGVKFVEKFLKSNTQTKAIIIPLVMLAGGITKYWTLKFNRFGSKEFKVENKDQLDKKEFKKAKKALNSKRHWLNFKNFCTGA